MWRTNVLVYTNQRSSGADAGTYLAVVTVHQRVGNDTFVVSPLGSKNVNYLLTTKWPCLLATCFDGTLCLDKLYLIRHLCNLTGFWPVFDLFLSGFFRCPVYGRYHKLCNVSLGCHKHLVAARDFALYLYVLILWYLSFCHVVQIISGASATTACCAQLAN